ncbi:dihydroorotase [Hyphomicrobium sp.]|uniref:dihydroorotase n=1 Tax=Hyphomicrobium sp. TaxID=82 RepID=UPI000FA0D1AF|nr:dihydroorotase [Hyphomicrobium sp.]RUO99331.1 MAG: dihydroorotase [Hyphomicrobium sp.]
MRKPIEKPKNVGQETVFINARLVDPASNRDEPGGLLVKDGMIADLGGHLRRNAPDGATVIDCKGNVLAPGLIDAQVFTGEPGYEHRETLKTASHAAAAGGVTTIVVMPDTNPVIDQVALVDFIQRRARDNALVHVHTMAAMTKGLQGEEMTEIGLLKRAGAIAFANGKASVVNTRVMRNVLSYAKDFNALVVHHTEDPYLSNGAMNSGEVAARLGLSGVSKIAETIVLERDVRLVAMTGGRYHAATISCLESLEVIRGAKAKKLPVSCGVSINHLTLNENDIGPYRTFFKVRPPLRREEDRVAMVQGVANGDIDIIVSSHDPQDADTKRRPFAEAADGAVGIETLLSAALRLVHSGDITLSAMLRALTINPARLLGLHSGRLAKGAIADLVLFDPGEPWVVNKDLLRSRSKNTPFDEAKMQGRVLRTVVAGQTVFEYAGVERT